MEKNLYNDWEELEDAFHKQYYEFLDEDWWIYDRIVDESPYEEIEDAWNNFLKYNMVRTPEDDYSSEIDEEFALNHEHDEEILGGLTNIVSYATIEECEACCKRERDEKVKERNKWKKVRVEFELETDERYGYYNNKASLELYVDKSWSEKRIRNYVKNKMWTSVFEIKDDYYCNW